MSEGKNQPEPRVKIDMIQCVLFSPGIAMADKIEMASTARAKIQLQGEVAILPVPEDAPYEVPRIQLFSPDQVYTLLIAKNRIDLLFRPKSEMGIGSFPPMDLLEKAIATFEYSKETLSARITRVGFVSSWVIDLGNLSAVREVISRYIKQTVTVPNAHEVELHFLSKENIQEFAVNRWTRLRTMREATKADSLVSLLVDLNTLAEIDYNFTISGFDAFLREGSGLMKKTVDDHLKILAVREV